MLTISRFCARAGFAGLLGVLAITSVYAASPQENFNASCAHCHSFKENTVGPQLCGVIGRKAGTVAGFEYSKGMKASGITWNAAKLDAFLASPWEAVEGTTMEYDGFSGSQERKALIDYLTKIKPATGCK